MSDNRNPISNTDSTPDSKKPNDEDIVSESCGKDNSISNTEQTSELRENKDPNISSDIHILQSILEELSKLRVLFNQRLSYDIIKEKAFERLYEELDNIKSNDAFEKRKSHFLDLILLHDRMGSLQDKPELCKEDRCSFKSLKEELIEILSREEIDLIETKGALFDPEYQQAVGTEKVDSAAESGKVVLIVRKGFRYRDRLLRPEEVIVTRYEKINSNTEEAFETDLQTGQKGCES
jgi:molecular chaperone GrpE (heat shock protein)